MAEQDNRRHREATIDFTDDCDELAARPTAVIEIDCQKHEAVDRSALKGGPRLWGRIPEQSGELVAG